MSFPLSHWSTPRASIATAYQDNDLGYVTHGAHAVADVLRALDILPSLAWRSSLLDFGCGTARTTRILTRHFSRVVGFDPSPECLALAERENNQCKPLRFPNLQLCGSWPEVMEFAAFDFVSAINVFEHLDLAGEREAFDRVAEALKPGGRAVLWLRPGRNARLIQALELERPDCCGIGIFVWQKG